MTRKTKQQIADENNVGLLFVNLAHPYDAAMLRDIWGADTVARWIAAGLVSENNGLISKAFHVE